jgi:uncharacterized membrane protein YeiB
MIAGLTTTPAGAPPAALHGPAARRRIQGIDLARAIAILGMLAVHIGPTGADDLAGRLYALPHGRASILFGLLAGVGVSLLASGRTSSLREARLTLAWRALVLLPAGLALQLLDHGAYVILQDYALLFVVGALVLALRDRWLLTLAAAVGVLGPLAYLWGRVAAPDAFTRETIEFGDPVGGIVHGLVLSGPYPLITWAAPFLIGVWIGRRDLRAGRVRVRLLAAGAAVAVAAAGVSTALTTWLGEPAGVPGWDHLLLDTPHSQMPLWLVGATASAAFVLGAALVVADAAGRLAWPLVATGQLALTVYVGHLLALHAAGDALASEEVGGAVLLVAGFTVVAAAASTAWRSLFARGPLEAVLHAPSYLLWRHGRARRT